MTVARRFVVEGRVQGVGFRWATWETASRLGVAGWVRNRPDGAVEGWVEGDDGAVDAMVDWLGEGPMGASVDRLTAEEASPAGHAGFEIAG